MVATTLRDCPTRPPCPKCGMAMLTVERIEYRHDFEGCRYECLRCGHAETSEPAEISHRKTG